MATAIVVAAGSGERLGASQPKALVELAGRPMLAWSVRALAAAESVDGAIVAAPPGFEARVEVLALEAAPMLDTRVVAGGGSRSQSVANALRVVDTEIVLVHDAARPLVTPELIDDCVAELAGCGADAVIAAVPVADTVKRVDTDGRVSETLERDGLWAIQTPQIFKADPLRRAITAGDLGAATDDAQLVERAGGDIRVFESKSENLKVTTAADLRAAELLLADVD